jgi:glycosyltransferase involved in cell wall biosynthesis
MIARVWSWFAFAARAGAWLTAAPAEATVLVCTNPPFMPAVAAAVSGVRRFAVVARVLDVYPDVLRATSFRENRILWLILAGLNRWTYARCRSVQTLGPQMAELISAHAPTSAVAVVPECLPPDTSNATETKDTARGLLGLPPEGLIVLASGNLGMTHDLQPLADAARAMRDDRGCHFVISTTQMAAVRQLFGDDANVTVVPHLADVQYKSLLRAADIAVLSLRPGAEAASFPSRTLSYLAAGLPIVAITRRPGDLADLADAQGCGAVVPPGAPDRLVEVIRGFVGDGQTLRACGQSAREAARRFADGACVSLAAERLENLARSHVAAGVRCRSAEERP